MRLDEVSGTLSALEIEDLVTVRDVAAVAQRLEMVRRIAGEIDGYVVELGTDGRLLSLQLDELIAGVDTDRELVARDYLPHRSGRRAPYRLRGPGRARRAVVRRPARPRLGRARDRPQQLAARRSTARSRRAATGCSRGCRGCPRAVVDRLVDHFGALQKLLAAGIDDLQAVEGVGESRARTVREGLSRLAESSILERYV